MRFLNDYKNLNTINDMSIMTNTNILSSMSATALSDTKVFITYLNNNYLHGAVCNLDGTSIVLGTATKLCTLTSINITSTVKLNDSKVFIGFAKTGNVYYYGLVCSVSGNTITAGNQVLISESSSSVTRLSIVALAEDKICFSYYWYSAGTYHIYSVICTIKNLSITIGEKTLISNVGNSIYNLVTVALNNSKIAMLYSYKTYIVINICEVSEKNIVELGFSLSDFATDVGVHFLSATALNENSVFTTFDYSSDRYLYGKVFKISGSTITKGVDTQLSTANFSASLERDCSILRIDESTVNVFHNYNSSQYLYSLLCTISETTITKKNDVQLSSVPKSGLYITAMALSEKDVFVLHSDGSLYGLAGIITDYLITKLAKTITSSTEQINGVAITSGQAGETVSVKKPDV